MTRTSIKIIYLTLLWTLTCPFLQCFSLLSPLNYITLLTSIQSLEALSLKVSEESYDLINKAIQNNPDLIKKLFTESGSSKSKLSSFPPGVPVINGISSIFPHYGTGMYSVKNPVTVALPKEVISNGQKYVLTNRLNLLGNFFKKATSAIASPVSSSLNYLKKLGQNQGVLPDVLKSISNRLKVGNGNKESEEESEEEEEEEERPKKSKKKKKVEEKEEDEEEEDKEEDDDEEEKRPKKSKKDAKMKKPETEDEDDDEEEEEEEKPNKSKNDAKMKKPEKEDDDDDDEEEEEKPNKSKKKRPEKKEDENEDEEEGVDEEGDEDEGKDKDDEEEEDKGDEDDEDEDEEE